MRMLLGSCALILGVVAASSMFSGCDSGGHGITGSGGGGGGPLPNGAALHAVTTALDFPVFLTAPPNDPDRLFVVEKGGTIRLIRGDSLLATPFLDLHGLVSSDVEQGLL